MKRALVCPLDWGLGHATRCVPIIRKLQADGYCVSIAADGYPLAFLQKQFPSLEFIQLASYDIIYAKGKSQIWAMLKQSPKLILAIFKEHSWLQKILANEPFDLIVSDNRFGLWTNKTECWYITHQLMVKMPRALKLFEPFVWLLHRSIINRYSTCLIPDFAQGKTLSGELAHKYPLPKNARFIGPLSRFDSLNTVPLQKKYDVVCIVSGVEPQRTLFENQLIERFSSSTQAVLIVCGQPSNSANHRRHGSVELVNHLADEELADYLKNCTKIIARSGYSTIMDLHALNCLHKCEFIPTPGQTEQIYLFQYHELKM